MRCQKPALGVWNPESGGMPPHSMAPSAQKSTLVPKSAKASLPLSESQNGASWSLQIAWQRGYLCRELRSRRNGRVVEGGTSSASYIYKLLI
jgi:hypothetical protein